jgi:putative FmdB family regulatory protein
MPVYEYECPLHGEFESMRPMSEYQREQPCPQCGSGSPRVLLRAPQLAVMQTARLKAHQANEASRHEPRVISQSRHGPACRCCNGNATGARGERAAPRGFPTRRPWMISH